jgi:hypothetical protein
MKGAVRDRLDIVSSAGLAIGGVFGLAGTFVGQLAIRQIFWAIDRVGIVVTTALLALRYFRRSDDCVAAGFLVFLAGESLLPSAPRRDLRAAFRLSPAASPCGRRR